MHAKLTRHPGSRRHTASSPSKYVSPPLLSPLSPPALPRLDHSPADNVQWHPDKNPSPEAEEKFKDIGEAYQILSNPDTRAFYDKVGKAGMTQPEAGMEDPQEIFSKLFGGGTLDSLSLSLSLSYISTVGALATLRTVCAVAVGPCRESSALSTVQCCS